MADLVTPHTRVSPLRDFVNRLSAAHTAASNVSPYARAGLHALRAGGTSLLTGAALGYADARFGGLDYKGRPVDGMIALGALAATLLLANDPDGLGVEARSVMTVSSGILAYRKTKAWEENRKRVSAHGDEGTTDSEDPIFKAARELDEAA
jgi:hypothetical protein